MTGFPKSSFSSSDPAIKHTSNAIKAVLTSLLQNEESPPFSQVLADDLEQSWDNVQILDVKLREVLLSIESLNLCLFQATTLFETLTGRRRDMVKILRERQNTKQVTLPPEIISYICSLWSKSKQAWGHEEGVKVWGPYWFQSTECHVGLKEFEEPEDKVAKSLCSKFSNVVLDLDDHHMYPDFYHTLLESAFSFCNKWSAVEMLSQDEYSVEDCSDVFGCLDATLPYIRKLRAQGTLTRPDVVLGPHQRCCLGCRYGLKASRCTDASINIDDVRLFPCMLPSLTCLLVHFNYSGSRFRMLGEALSDTVWGSVRTLKIADDSSGHMTTRKLKPDFFLTSPRVDAFPNIRTLVVVSHALDSRVVCGLFESLHCYTLNSLVLGDLTGGPDNDIGLVNSDFEPARITELMDAIGRNCASLRNLKFYVFSDGIEKRLANVRTANSLILSALTPTGDGNVPLPLPSCLALPHEERWKADPFMVISCLTMRRERGRALNTLQLTATNPYLWYVRDRDAEHDAWDLLCERLGLYANNVVFSSHSAVDLY